MPAIVYQSPAMASARLALVAQSFVEQSNGLVEVSAQYAAIADNASNVLPLFKTDAQPPIHPSIVNLENLQTHRLYLRDFNSTLANGMLEINTVYVGASLNALRKPSISDSVERKTFFIRVPALRTAANRYGYINGFPTLISEVSAVRYDRYGIEVHLRNEEQQVAVVANEAIDYAIPIAISTNERAGLLMGATFISKSIFESFGGDKFSGVEPPPNGGTDPTTVYGSKKLPGFDFRSMDALQILQALASASTSKTNAGVSVINTGKIEHVTPTVRLTSNSYELQFNASPIFSKWGATIS